MFCSSGWWEHVSELVNVLRLWNLESLRLNEGDVHLQQHWHVDNFEDESHLAYLDRAVPAVVCWTCDGVWDRRDHRKTRERGKMCLERVLT